MDNVQYVGGLFTDVFRVGEHFHQTYELVYYTRGQGTLHIGTNSVDFYPGLLVIIAPRVPHTDQATGGFQNLHINVRHPGFPVNSYAVIRDSANRDMFKILFQIHSEYHIKRQNWRALVDSLYEVLRQYMLTFIDKHPLNPYVERMLSDIIDNLANPSYEICQTIQAMPFHPQYFRDLFCKEIGCTPNQYLMKKRLEYAQELILAKPLSGSTMKEIAQQCGWQDFYYFSRLFKQYTGLSPRHWAAVYGQEQR